MRFFWLLSFAWLASCQCEKDEVDGNEWTVIEGAAWEEVIVGGEGGVRWNDGVLSLSAGVELTCAKYTGPDLPEMPYELEWEARKVMGSDFFCGLTFPVSSNEECVTLILGGWGGGTVGISSIDGMHADENETTTYGNFEQGEWYDIRVVVEEGRLRAFLDGEKVVDVKTEGRKLTLRPGAIEGCAPFGLATFQTSAEVRNLRWRSLAD